MSAIDVVFVVSAALLTLVGWVPLIIRKPITVGAVAIAITAGVGGFILEGPRWQLLVVAAGTLIGLVLALLRLRPARDRARGSRIALRSVAIATTFGCLATIAVGGAAAWAVPVLALPEPTGSLAVATMTVQWVDEGRDQPATADPDDYRTIVGQLWYPADTDTAPAAYYLGRDADEAAVVASSVAAAYGLPAFLLGDVAVGRTNSTPGSPPPAGDERFPVVLFSPGLGGVRMQNTTWAEELASHGYVVVALDHPYDSAIVVMDDGTAVTSALAATGDPAEDNRLAAGWTAVRAADLSFALTSLERLDAGEGASGLTGRLDTDRAAVTGHSIGGAAAIQAAAQDDRFDAVINIDGFPRYVPPAVNQRPLLAFVAGNGTGNPTADDEFDRQLKSVLERRALPSYRLTVAGAAHLTFTDAALYLPPLPSLFGSLSRTDGPRITAGASLAFLNATLRNARPDLGRDLARFGEVEEFPPVTPLQPRGSVDVPRPAD